MEYSIRRFMSRQPFQQHPPNNSPLVGLSGSSLGAIACEFCHSPPLFSAVSYLAAHLEHIQRNRIHPLVGKTSAHLSFAAFITRASF